MCPVCRCSRRATLHTRLRDLAFRMAPGEWTLYRCQGCDTAYLDPRPTKTSLSRAYGNYYTHEPDAASQSELDTLGPYRWARRIAANSYLNSRFGTKREPSIRGARFVLELFPSQRLSLDSEFRHLPKPLLGQRLLDIGCGNGSFLKRAASAGWTVSGIDFDPLAVEAAVNSGIDAHVSTIEEFICDDGVFDAITLSHVIEHVHDPVGIIRRVSQLLKPAGLLFIETPNVNSIGALMYGACWRGLEPPRHLVLFTPLSLERALNECGFSAIRLPSRHDVAKGMFLQSSNIRADRPALSPVATLSVSERIRAVCSQLAPSRSEFITFMARKRDDA